MKKSIYITLLALTTLFSACSDELDIVPSKQVKIVPTKVEYLEGLLANNNSFERNALPKETILRSPDYNIQDLIARKDREITDYLKDITWEYTTVENTAIGEEIWKEFYKYILVCNTALDYADQVKGTEERISAVKADAYFQRAFYHFRLLLEYGAAYKKASADSDLGIVIRKSSELATDKRASVADSYAFILEDLNKAEELMGNRTLAENNSGVVAQYKASLGSIQGLKAKVYLSMNDYENAKSYAEKAIANKGLARLVNYATEVPYDDNLDIERSAGGVDYVFKLPVTSSPGFRLCDWKENIFVARRSVTFLGFKAVPSDELMNLYGADATERMYDQRWEKMFIQNGSILLDFNVGDKPVLFDTYTGLFQYGVTLSEMQLIKAECEARSGNFGNAQTIVNDLRALRFDTDAPDNIVN